MTPERQKELAQQMGLDDVPKPRYEDIPPENVPMGRLVEFKKMVMLGDRLLTAAFWRFIPDCVVIDHMMDGTTYSGDNCFGAMIRTDIPPPVNVKITRATGLRGTMETDNFLLWLGMILKEHWTALAPRAMAPPLISAGRGNNPKRGITIPGARPFMGIAMKFDLRPPDGRTMADIQPSYGAIVPSTERVRPDRLVLPATGHAPVFLERKDEEPS